MGDEASPPIANLFLYQKEKQFVEACIARLGEDEVKRKYHGFKYVLRYIDDRISPAYDDEDALPGREAYGLDLTETARSTEAVFLGIVVNTDANGEVTFVASDKQKFFNAPVIRFPTWHTKVPEETRIGTVIGMLVRTLRLTTMMDDFFAEAQYLIQLFRERSYAKQTMRHALYKFASRHVRPRYTQRMREELNKMIEDWDVPEPIRLVPPQPNNDVDEQPAVQDDAVATDSPEPHRPGHVDTVHAPQRKRARDSREVEDESVPNSLDELFGPPPVLAESLTEAATQVIEGPARRQKKRDRSFERSSKSPSPDVTVNLYGLQLDQRCMVVERNRRGEETTYIGNVVGRYNDACIKLKLDSGSVVALPRSYHMLVRANGLEE